jgi:hypothetical protein
VAGAADDDDGEVEAGMLDTYRDLIDELLGTPTALRALVERREAGDVPPGALGAIAGLRDRDRAVLGRLQAMQRRQDALLPALAAAEPAAEPGEPAALLAEFDAARADLVSHLVNLSLKDWERTAIHEVDGEITLADEVERHVEFDEEAMARIEAEMG